MHWHTPTLAERLFHGARRGETVSLPRAGTHLENPFVYDAVVREIKDIATGFGGLDVLTERHAGAGVNDDLIAEFVFRRP